MRPIKEIRLVYPSVMGNDAASKIRELIDSISEMEDRRAQLFMEQEELSKKIAENQQILDAFNKTYEVIYEEPEVKKEVIENNYGPAIKESNGTFHGNF